MLNELASSEWALLLADTDATQAYVFESNKLPEIRGASRMLDTLNDQIGDQVRDNIAAHGGDLIFAGGGGLLAVVNAAQAAALVSAIESHYPQQTTTATISAISRPLPADYAHAFGRFVTWGSHWLRQHKESKPAPPFVVCLPDQARCQSCDLRPADAQLSAQHPEPDYRICQVCFRKHETGTGPSRRFWFDAFRDHTPADSVWHTTTNLTYPYSISEIAQASASGDKLVGFVYLDGDSIGRLLQRLETPEQYRTVSETLKEATQTAVFDALAALLAPAAVTPSELRPHADPDSTVTIYPFEIVTIGGDDVILIVPASVALPLAAQIGRLFADRVRTALRTRANLDETISMSAGVLLADDHTPLGTMADVARQLLKRAKRLGGAIDFHIMYSADMLDRSISVVRETYPYTIQGAGDRGRSAYLLGRPYTHDNLTTLWTGMQRMKQAGFATSQLHQLADALLRGRREATLFYEYQRHRSRDDQGYQALATALTAGQAPGSADPQPWMTVANATYSHRTTLWDISELYKFVSLAPANGGDVATGEEGLVHAR